MLTPSHSIGLENAVDPGQGLVPILPVRFHDLCDFDIFSYVPSYCSYWVMAVVPYLLYAFCTNHTEEECERIFRVLIEWIPYASPTLTLLPYRYPSHSLCGTK